MARVGGTQVLTIWKMQLALAPVQPVHVPEGARMLTAREQNEMPCIWFLCDPAKPTSEERTIRVYGTGHAVPDDPGRYLGTCHLHGGSLVLHVFEAEK